MNSVVAMQCKPRSRFSVFVASVVHGFTVGLCHGNGIAIKVAKENITGTSEGAFSGGHYTAENSGVTRHSLQIAETGANSTLEFVLLRNGTNPAITAAMDVCIKALKSSTEQVEAAAAAFQSSDATTQGQAFDDLRAQMSAALEISRTCVIDCFVELSPYDSEAEELFLACSSLILSHSQVWMNAEELCWQFLNLEFNRIQLAPWHRSSNSSEVPEP